jgi:hypothetical protein
VAEYWKRTSLTVRLFVDERIITAESEGRLHKAVSKLRQDVKKGNSNISSKNAEIMTLAGDESVKEMCILDREITEGIANILAVICFI